MELEKLDYDLSVCKLSGIDMIDFTRNICFLAITPDEISLVCESDHVPPNTIEIENGWKALKLSGVLDFSLIGVVAKISNILAEAKISIFVVSTYNTDYILLKAENFNKGIQVLMQEGYTAV